MMKISENTRAQVLCGVDEQRLYFNKKQPELSTTYVVHLEIADL